MQNMRHALVGETSPPQQPGERPGVLLGSTKRWRSINGPGSSLTTFAMMLWHIIAMDLHIDSICVASDCTEVVANIRCSLSLCHYSAGDQVSAELFSGP